MLGHISGTIIHKSSNQIIVSNGFQGYLINITSSFAQNLTTDAQIQLYLHTKVKEDDISLYGFPTLAELEFFRQLIAISGIGPKIALDLISHDLQEVKSAIATENADFLARFPGIGKKTAQRVVLELKSKIDTSNLQATTADSNNLNTLHQEAMDALLNLGYHKKQVNAFLNKLQPETKLTSEQIILNFLQQA